MMKLQNILPSNTAATGQFQGMNYSFGWVDDVVNKPTVLPIIYNYGTNNYIQHITLDNNNK